MERKAMILTRIGHGRCGRLGLLLLVSVALAAAGCGNSKARRQNALRYVEAGKKAHWDGDKKKGLALYNKAIEIDPECKEAYVQRGTLYSEAGRPKDALKDFTTAIKLDPNDSYPYEQRAFIYRNHLHDEAKAKADDERAFEIRQQNRDDMRKRVKGR
jgi:Tfp pilus assembly protein PilF